MPQKVQSSFCWEGDRFPAYSGKDNESASPLMDMLAWQTYYSNIGGIDGNRMVITSDDTNNILYSPILFTNIFISNHASR